MSRDSIGTLEISVIRPCDADDGAYRVFVPGYGTTDCLVFAKSANEAKRKLADYVGNELLGRRIE